MHKYLVAIILAVAGLLGATVLPGKLNKKAPVEPPRASQVVSATAPSDCASSQTRPCYERQASGKLVWLNLQAGENAFGACVKSSSPRDQGVLFLKTTVSEQEKVSYCYEGKSQVVLRKFEGQSGSAAVDTNPNCPNYQPVPYHQLYSVSMFGSPDIAAYPANIQKFVSSLNVNVRIHTLMRTKSGAIVAGGEIGTEALTSPYTLPVLQKSSDGGKTWASINFPVAPQPYQGITAIIQDTKGNLYAAGHGIGVAKSEDDGNTWKLLPWAFQPNTGFPYDGAQTETNTVDHLIALKDGGIVAVIRFWPSGHWYTNVYKSVDGGSAWNKLFTYDDDTMRSVVEADNGDLVFSVDGKIGRAHV